MSELKSGDKHLMRLILRDKQADGWTKVSAMVWPLLEKLPSELIELDPKESGGFVRLTSKGEIVLAWL